mmetsp:Transcript_9878/g.15015  ORF Transcript_9878/g.15015 Transcript_9878/m.15015 type:complete len:112 (-) Transcript_9878:722-1057(-)
MGSTHHYLKSTHLKTKKYIIPSNLLHASKGKSTRALQKKRYLQVEQLLTVTATRFHSDGLHLLDIFFVETQFQKNFVMNLEHHLWTRIRSRSELTSTRRRSPFLPELKIFR